MPAEELKLEQLAACLADGTPVDWERELERAPSQELKRQIGHLRLVADIQSVHTTSEALPLTREELVGMTSTIDVDSLRPGAAPAAGDEVPERWGHLEIREKLGQGGFGEVYRAWDPNLEREVALKLLKRSISGDAERSRTALKEGRLLARVRHPNVITVYGAETHDGRVGLWMEFVRGKTISRIAAEQGRLGAREATLIGLELCRALAAVHAAGLVHRDVKAANAMRDEDGRLLLMDFGAGEDAAALADSEVTTISGTPLYIAPEVYAGKPATAASDIYGMGVLLYFLVTGSYPVSGDSVREIRDRLDSRDVRLLRDERPDLPDAFVQLVERALAHAPADRFATAGQLEAALSASLGIESGSTRVEPRTSDGRRWARAGLLVAAAAAVVVVAWMLKGPFAPAGRTEQAPSAAAPTTARPGEYSVKASLYRIRDETRERIDAGARLRVGDELTLELTASRDLHVYVFNEDEKGNAYALFPLPSLDTANPLPAGRDHVLPGTRDGAAFRWQVTSAGDREHLVVLASPEPLAEFETELARLALPSPDAVALPVPAESRERLRGIGGLTQAAPQQQSSDTARLFDMARRLSGQAETVEGVWMREIVLDNPED